MSLNISKILNGIAAGFAGTLVITTLMMFKNMAGIMPALDPVHMLANMIAQTLSIEPSIGIGWAMHFAIGSIAWGGALAIFNTVIPGQSQIKKGVNVGVIAWLMMMLGPMPMSGAGLFGLNIGVMAPLITLLLHLVFGGVLGFVYAKLNQFENI